jgi:hypothetical protein
LIELMRMGKILGTATKETVYIPFLTVNELANNSHPRPVQGLSRNAVKREAASSWSQMLELTTNGGWMIRRRAHFGIPPPLTAPLLPPSRRTRRQLRW